MEFTQFRALMQKQFEQMTKDYPVLFVTDVDRFKLWDTYLDSFPEGTNELYRERREYDCSCCRHFIRAFGNVVAIDSRNRLVSIWDFATNDPTFGPVARAMASFVRSGNVMSVFLTKETSFGVDHNFEQLAGRLHRWDHFYVKVPEKCKNNTDKTTDTILGRHRETREVFERSLKEISRDSIETVLDLISQNSLYKGEEWKAPLELFLSLHIDYHKLGMGGKLETDEDLQTELRKEKERANFCWRKATEVGGSVGKIKNHSIGALLVDVTKGTDLEVAVKKYESMVAPHNYKRPKAIFTKKMLEDARKKLEALGFMDSLGRRYAMLGDITVRNILFANPDAKRALVGGVFEELSKEVAVNPKQFGRVEEVSVDHFLKDILPRVTSIEVLLENRHTSDLVSVIAPAVPGSPSMFKWANGFSWAYAGNMTDSMKERVKAAGGNVEGVLRFSLQWNTEGGNQNDFDAHCIEPAYVDERTGRRHPRNEIYYPKKGKRQISSGMLDVDIIHPKPDQVAVENITWDNLDRMPEGVYKFFVNNYSHRGGTTGFSAEIEYGGEIYSFNYNRELRQSEDVVVAEVSFSRHEGIHILKSLPSETSSKKVWGLDTNQFHPVSICMFSPNYWDDQSGIGHRHVFFILQGCLNDTTPNGFFNEFLREDLMDYKRVFEALGNKMKVEPSVDQLSGLGFSTTKRNSVVCKLGGHTERTVKIVF
jgi:hypothetical protein